MKDPCGPVFDTRNFLRYAARNTATRKIVEKGVFRRVFFTRFTQGKRVRFRIVLLAADPVKDYRVQSSASALLTYRFYTSHKL